MANISILSFHSVQSEPLWEEHMPGGHSSLLWNMVHTENLWKIRQLPPSIQAAIIYAIILTQITRLAEPPVRTIVVCWGKNGKFPMKVEVVKIKTWSAYFVDAGWGWGGGSVFQLHSIWLLWKGFPLPPQKPDRLMLFFFKNSLPLQSDKSNMTSML